jgi:hypothetical protein
MGHAMLGGAKLGPLEAAPSLPSCDDLVASLERARQALFAGDPVDAGAGFACAYSCAVELYGRLDPTRAIVCAHLQCLLETCIARIEYAQVHADASALEAALQLVQPWQSVLARVIDADWKDSY